MGQVRLGLDGDLQPSRPGAASADLDRPSVLLVDDDPSVLLVVSKLLGRAGYQVVTAADGPAALAVVASGRSLAAIVTDYAMPGMNGARMLEQAARLRAGPPALIVTGFADGAEMETLGPGVDVLCKPFMRAELLAKLRQMVGADRPLGRPAGPGVEAG